MNLSNLNRSESYDIENYYNGIYRKKIDDKYKYYYTKNNVEVSATDYERIYKLIIPPSWDNVWVSNDPKTAIQVIGIDSKKRKQYKYNNEHIKKSTSTKFNRLFNFIKKIPKLEKSIKKHMKLPKYEKNKIISTMLMIVKKLYLRVGKEEYAKHNKSYGISSLEKKHIKIKNDTFYLNFKGKSNQILKYKLKDKYLTNHIIELLKLKGDKIFQYVEDDKIKKISYVDLNKYVHKYMGPDFSVKDFRTYAANYYFIKSLIKITTENYPKNNVSIKKNIKKAVIQTAEYLHHTESISKKSYIMNFCVELYQTSPEFFVENKHLNINDIILKILSLKNDIINK